MYAISSATITCVDIYGADDYYVQLHSSKDRSENVLFKEVQGTPYGNIRKVISPTTYFNLSNERARLKDVFGFVITLTKDFIFEHKEKHNLLYFDAGKGVNIPLQFLPW